VTACATSGSGLLPLTFMQSSEVPLQAKEAQQRVRGQILT
jgi:hypothetical protein